MNRELILSLAIFMFGLQAAAQTNSVTVVNSASFEPGPVAPGQLITIFGSGMGPPNGQSTQIGPDGKIADTLAGVIVTFDGERAPLFFVRADQINAQVPYSVSKTSGTRMEISYQGRTVASTSLSIAETQYGIFTGADGTKRAIAVDTGGRLNNPNNPFAPGQVFTMYGTGEGQTDPEAQTGRPVTLPLPLPRTPLRFWYYGGPAASGFLDPEYAGGAPGFSGLLQLNLRLPRGPLPPGVYAIRLVRKDGLRTENAGRISPPGYVYIGNTPPELPDFYIVNHSAATKARAGEVLYNSVEATNGGQYRNQPVDIGFTFVQSNEFFDSPSACGYPEGIRVGQLVKCSGEVRVPSALRPGPASVLAVVNSGRRYPRALEVNTQNNQTFFSLDFTVLGSTPGGSLWQQSYEISANAQVNGAPVPLTIMLDYVNGYTLLVSGLISTPPITTIGLTNDGAPQTQNQTITFPVRSDAIVIRNQLYTNVRGTFTLTISAAQIGGTVTGTLTLAGGLITGTFEGTVSRVH